MPVGADTLTRFRGARAACARAHRRDVPGLCSRTLHTSHAICTTAI